MRGRCGLERECGGSRAGPGVEPAATVRRRVLRASASVLRRPSPWRQLTSGGRGWESRVWETAQSAGPRRTPGASHAVQREQTKRRQRTRSLVHAVVDGPPVRRSGTKTERHAVAVDRPIRRVNERFRGCGWSPRSAVSLDGCPLHWLPAGKTMRHAGGGRASWAAAASARGSQKHNPEPSVLSMSSRKGRLWAARPHWPHGRCTDPGRDTAGLNSCIRWRQDGVVDADTVRAQKPGRD